MDKEAITKGNSLCSEGCERRRLYYGSKVGRRGLSCWNCFNNRGCLTVWNDKPCQREATGHGQGHRAPAGIKICERKK
jgi:hypothetical protein